jgi:hypothetical protein
MKRILFLLILSIIYFKTDAQVKLNIWTQTDKVAQTLTTDKLGQLPQTFESKMPDGSTVVYEKWERPTVNFTTSSGKKSEYKPQVWRAKQGAGLVSLTNKGWMGLHQTSNGKSFSMTYNKINPDGPKKIRSECNPSEGTQITPQKLDVFSDLKTNIPKMGKLTPDKSTSEPPTIELNREDFYNPGVAIPVVLTLYVETSWKIFNYFYPNGSTETQLVEDWINLMYQNVSLVFDREGVNLQLQDVLIWDTQDPYGIWSGTLPSAMTKFTNCKNNNLPRAANGYFKQLLHDVPGGGADGIADGSFSRGNGFTFPAGTVGKMSQISAININSAGPGGYVLPDPVGSTSYYNWTVQLSSHELGHNMGCLHTHNCGFWRNDLNQPIARIDSCVLGDLTQCPPIKSPKDYTIPSIMSYCWGDEPTPPFARDFILQNGFGRYPRFALRSNVYFSQYPPNIPTVSTTSIDNITINSVKVNSTLTNVGTWHYIQRGIRYWKSSESVNSAIFIIASGGGSRQNPITTIGDYTIDLLNLVPGTQYNVQSFASNFAGASYGNILSFTTLPSPCPPGTGIPTITLNNNNIIGFGSTNVGGNITTNDGQSLLPPPSANGVLWSLYPFSLNNPSVVQAKYEIGYTGSLGTFPYNIILNDSELGVENSYYYKTFATSNCGTGYSQDGTINFNGIGQCNTLPLVIVNNSLAKFQGSTYFAYTPTITERGFEIISSNDLSGGTTATIPLEGPFEYDYQVFTQVDMMYRAFVKISGGKKYGIWRRFTLQNTPGIPTISTATTTNTIQCYNALVDISVGCPIPPCQIINKGVVWSTNPFPDISLPTKIVLSNTTGNSKVLITGLQPQTQYYQRGFVTFVYQGNTYTIYTTDRGKFTTKPLGSCEIQNLLAAKIPNTSGIKEWKFQFDLNPTCSTYTVTVSRYKNFNPSVPPAPNAIPTSTSNRLVNYLPTVNEINAGLIYQTMVPQPQLPSGVTGCWFSVNVNCNGGCTGSQPTKYFFFVNKLDPID